MDRLEDILKQGRQELESASTPADGHLERFESRLEARQRSRRARIFRIAFPSVAAAAAIALGVFLFLRGGADAEDGNYFAGVERTPESIYDSFLKQVRKEYTRMASLQTADMAGWEETFLSVTSEGIPMNELLPEELSEDERADILISYYHSILESMYDMDSHYTQILADNSF